MPSFHFYKMNPGGNTTIFILDPVPSTQRVAIARQLLQADHLQAEQVGFLCLESSPVRLDMMGGEFCGNACRATAIIMAMEKTGLISQNDMLYGQISVSGTEELLEVYLEKKDICWAQMPFIWEEKNIFRLGTGQILVRLPGITHLCLDEDIHFFPDDFVQAASDWRKKLDISEPAVGCIWYNRDKLSIKPVVWVKATDSTYYESACGSGSLALALAMLEKDSRGSDIQVVQPSGAKIGVKIDMIDKKAWIYGQVECIARGEVFIYPRPEVG